MFAMIMVRMQIKRAGTMVGIQTWGQNSACK